MLEGKGSGLKEGGKNYYFFNCQPDSPIFQPSFSQPASQFSVREREKEWGRREKEREEAITHKIGANAEIKYLRKAMIAIWERR